MKEWLRPKDIISIYGIGKTRAYELTRQFRQEADLGDYIKDGGVLIVNRNAFETWWIARSKER